VRALSRGEFLRELEGTQRELLLERARAERELAGLRQRLEGVRARLESGELAEDDERRLTEELGLDLKALLAGAPGDRPALVAGVLQRERERRQAALARALTGHRERIDVLERRVAKLRASLAQMEEELGNLAARVGQDDGIASIYRQVQGLSFQETQRQAKLGLLRAIFEANLELQRPAA
jgi:hypothetical protein